jgi:hypothetical protein
MGDDVGGIAVHIGARVAALAGAGEVLVSSTVKDLVAGSGLRFGDRGRSSRNCGYGVWYSLSCGTGIIVLRDPSTRVRSSARRSSAGEIVYRRRFSRT